MSVLVSVSDDVESALISTLAVVHPSPNDFRSTCASLITSSYSSFLLQFLTPSSIDLILTMEQREAEAMVTMICGLIKKVQDGKEEEKIETEIVAALKKSEKSNPESKLRLMCNLYNLRPSPSTPLLISVLSYASQTSQFKLLAKNVTEVDAMLNGVEAVGKRKAYLLAKEAFESIGDEGEGRKAAVKYLLTFTPSERLTPMDRPICKSLLRSFLTSPMTLWSQSTSFSELSCVLEISSDPDFKGIKELLDVFEEGKFDDWIEWKDRYGGEKGLGLNLDKCEDAMRLLSLCSLAQEQGEIPFDSIASALRVPPASVERWVVQAIASGLITGKIDQVKSTVVVERSVVRKFGVEEWKKLNGVIGEWKGRVMKTMEELKGRQKK